jgi:hypothetical protein
MNACTNPHDSKLRHWFQARARHADGRPKAKRHPFHHRDPRDRLRDAVVCLWGSREGVEL